MLKTSEQIMTEHNTCGGGEQKMLPVFVMRKEDTHKKRVSGIVSFSLRTQLWHIRLYIFFFCSALWQNSEGCREQIVQFSLCSEHYNKRMMLGTNCTLPPLSLRRTTTCWNNAENRVLGGPAGTHRDTCLLGMWHEALNQAAPLVIPKERIKSPILLNNICEQKGVV